MVRSPSTGARARRLQLIWGRATFVWQWPLSNTKIWSFPTKEVSRFVQEGHYFHLQINRQCMRLEGEARRALKSAEGYAEKKLKGNSLYCKKRGKAKSWLEEESLIESIEMIEGHNNGISAVVKKNISSFLLFEGRYGVGYRPYQSSSAEFKVMDHDEKIIKQLQSWLANSPIVDFYG